MRECWGTAVRRFGALFMPPHTLGILLLGATMFLMFQAVFSWATVPMEAIRDGVGAQGQGMEPCRAVMAAIAALLAFGSTAFRWLPASPLLRQAVAPGKESA